MSRTILLGFLAVGAFASTFGVVRLLHRHSSPPGMIWIPGGEFTMGTDSELGWPDEKPAHRVHVNGFWMDETDVTNAQFQKFVEATGYVTTAEEPPDVEEIMKQVPPGTPPPSGEQLLPGSLVFVPPPGPVPLDNVKLAASRRAEEQHQGERKPSSGSGFVGRCHGLRQMG
jgi:sulfatase modifying factor 1